MGGLPAQEDFTEEMISMCVFLCHRERDRGSFVGRGVSLCKGSLAGVTRLEAQQGEEDPWNPP